jgi:membrane protein YdbS with pleckstrin-like domain
METQFRLNEGEKIEVDVKPDDTSLAYYLTIRGLIFNVIIAIVASCMAAAISSDNVPFQISKIVLVFLFVVIFLSLISLIGNTIKVPKLRYVLTDQRCIVYSGFIGINKKVVPYNRVADVNITQGSIESMFGFSTVEVDEQAMNFAGITSLIGLSREDAEQITEVISKHITKKQI